MNHEQTEWFWGMRFDQARGRVINERARRHAACVETIVMMCRVPQTERFVRKALDERLARERRALANIVALEATLKE